jgi:hypothetical protein
MEMTAIYRIFHPATAQCTFFTAAHGTFSKIDNIIVYKASLKNIRKLKKTLHTI